MTPLRESRCEVLKKAKISGFASILRNALRFPDKQHPTEENADRRENEEGSRSNSES